MAVPPPPPGRDVRNENRGGGPPSLGVDGELTPESNVLQRELRAVLDGELEQREESGEVRHPRTEPTLRQP